MLKSSSGIVAPDATMPAFSAPNQARTNPDREPGQNR
jgi:hypothetical protein